MDLPRYIQPRNEPLSLDDQICGGAVKRFLIPLILVLIHAALVVITTTLVATSPDPETEMIWTAFYYIDFPASRWIFAPPPTFTSTVSSFTLPILFVGSIQWGAIGFALQAILKPFLRQRRDKKQ
jgi:hypothetical protein